MFHIQQSAKFDNDRTHSTTERKLSVDFKYCTVVASSTGLNLPPIKFERLPSSLEPDYLELWLYFFKSANRYDTKVRPPLWSPRKAKSVVKFCRLRQRELCC